MTLRNFESKPPFNVWFKYPVHIWDSSEDFQRLRGEAEKTPLDKAEDGKATKKNDSDDRIREAVEKLIEENGLAQMADIEELSGFQRRRIWRFVDESDEYKRNKKGEVLRVDFSEKQEKSMEEE